MKVASKASPWIASTVVLLVILGVSSYDRGMLPFGTAEVAEAPVVTPPRPAVQPVSTLDEIAAIAPQVPSTTAQELAALIEEASAPQVTRTAPLETSITPLPDVVEAAAEPTLADDPTAFFAAAQANLAANETCGDDLRALAADARIYFPSSGLAPADAGLAQARLLSKVLADCPGYIVQVEGHSDPSGDPAVNLTLSKQRAEAVVSRIASAGIDASKLVAIGYGDERPSGVQGSEDDAYYDRRVEFTVIEQEQIQPASFTPIWQPNACVADLEASAAQIKLYYAPRAITVSSDELAEVMQLAVQTATCDGATLRIVGQHLDDPVMRETNTTGRHRALALMNTLVAAGISADQFLVGAPSWSESIAGQPGLPNSRVDFQIVATDG